MHKIKKMEIFRQEEQSFTLFELIIGIIVVSVITTLAIPRLFRAVEFSRAGEAFVGLSAIRTAMERCYMMRNGTYVGCNSLAAIGLEDPGSSPNAHFTYTIPSGTVSATGFTIRATRNTLERGDSSSTIVITQAGMDITRSGTGVFSSVR